MRVTQHPVAVGDIGLLFAVGRRLTLNGEDPDNFTQWPPLLGHGRDPWMPGTAEIADHRPDGVWCKRHKAPDLHHLTPHQRSIRSVPESPRQSEFRAPPSSPGAWSSSSIS